MIEKPILKDISDFSNEEKIRIFDSIYSDLSEDFNTFIENKYWGDWNYESDMYTTLSYVMFGHDLNQHIKQYISQG